ncbi:MAG: hypothetical protein Q9195_000621 [Heterodermia aff. obscurata]
MADPEKAISRSCVSPDSSYTLTDSSSGSRTVHSTLRSAMGLKLTQSLYDDFPSLFQRHTLGMDQSCMFFGIQVLSGWYHILYRLSSSISTVVSENGLDPQEYCYEQIKEKFGLLRVYMHGGTTEEIGQAIQRAVEESAKTCEVCGREGQLGDKGWLRVRCNECEEQRVQEQHKREGKESRIQGDGVITKTDSQRQLG